MDKKTLRKFGVTMGIAFLVITLVIFLRHRHNTLPTSIISAVFFILAFIAPSLLKPVYIFWMNLAFVLSWINTRLILLVIFYLIFTPVGLALRLFGVDLLDRKIDKHKESYWRKKEEKRFNPLNYERQF
jgi:hypothetical protein